MYWFIELPIGAMTAREENNAITELCFSRINFECECIQTPLLKETCNELTAYFAGQLTRFSVPLSPKGTLFQTAVWQELLKIPYGQTRTYKEIACAIGSPNSARAVGGACHNNPIAIIIPCHRVLGRNGSLTGFGGGLDIKQKLLDLERKYF